MTLRFGRRAATPGTAAEGTATAAGALQAPFPAAAVVVQTGQRPRY